MPYLSASAVVIHYEEALYQVYAPLPFTFYCWLGIQPVKNLVSTIQNILFVGS